MTRTDKLGDLQAPHRPGPSFYTHGPFPSERRAAAGHADAPAARANDVIQFHGRTASTPGPVAWHLSEVTAGTPGKGSPVAAVVKTPTRSKRRPHV